MHVRVKSPQDLGAAAVFAAIGGAGIYFGRDLAFGTASKMGPGYFPFYLSCLIVLLGAVLGARSLAVDGPGIEPPRWRPILFIIGSVLLFGYLLQLAGLLITAVAVTLLSAYARRDVKPGEMLLLGVGLAVFTAGVFIVALNQPLPLVWWSQ